MRTTALAVFPFLIIKPLFIAMPRISRAFGSYPTSHPDSVCVRGGGGSIKDSGKLLFPSQCTNCRVVRVLGMTGRLERFVSGTREGLKLEHDVIIGNSISANGLLEVNRQQAIRS